MAAAAVAATGGAAWSGMRRRRGYIRFSPDGSFLAISGPDRIQANWRVWVADLGVGPQAQAVGDVCPTPNLDLTLVEAGPPTFLSTNLFYVVPGKVDAMGNAGVFLVDVRNACVVYEHPLVNKPMYVRRNPENDFLAMDVVTPDVVNEGLPILDLNGPTPGTVNFVTLPGLGPNQYVATRWMDADTLVAFVAHGSPGPPSNVWIIEVGGVPHAVIHGFVESSSVYAVEVNPTNPDVVYVGTNQSLRACQFDRSSGWHSCQEVANGGFYHVLVQP